MTFHLLLLNLGKDLIEFHSVFDFGQLPPPLARFKFKWWEPMVQCCWMLMVPFRFPFESCCWKVCCTGGQPVSVWDQPSPHLHPNGPLQAAVQGASLYLGGRTDQVNTKQFRHTVLIILIMTHSISRPSSQATSECEPDQGTCGAWVQHCWRRGRGRHLYLLHPCRRTSRCVWAGKQMLELHNWLFPFKQGPLGMWVRYAQLNENCRWHLRIAI